MEACVLVVLTAAAALAQDSVPARLRRERVICVVPLVGAGTPNDPKRPLFAPRPGEPSAVEEYSWTSTDDGNFAIAEFVAGTPAVLDAVLNDARVAKAFRKGKAKRDDVEKELKKFKKDFSLDPVPGGAR